MLCILAVILLAQASAPAPDPEQAVPVKVVEKPEEKVFGLTQGQLATLIAAMGIGGFTVLDRRKSAREAKVAAAVATTAAATATSSTDTMTNLTEEQTRRLVDVLDVKLAPIAEDVRITRRGIDRVDTRAERLEIATEHMKVIQDEDHKLLHNDVLPRLNRVAGEVALIQQAKDMRTRAGDVARLDAFSSTPPDGVVKVGG